MNSPRDTGATLVEYGLVLLLVVLGAIILIQSIGDTVSDMFSAFLNAL